MSVYYIQPNDNFLLLLAEFISQYKYTQLNSLHIVLPHHVHCHKLKDKLQKYLSIKSITLLQIRTVEEFIDLLVSNIASTSIKYKLDFNQQRSILTTLIQKYSVKPVSVSDALKLSRNLLQIFQCIIYQQIQLNEIESFMQNIDISEHWYQNHQFLNQIYVEWYKLLGYEAKDIVEDLMTELQTILTHKYCTSTTAVIIAGLLPKNKLELTILKTIVNAGGIGGVILPPINLADLRYVMENCDSTKKLHNFQYFLHNCNIKCDDLLYLVTNKMQNTGCSPLTLLLDCRKFTTTPQEDNNTCTNNQLVINVEYNKANTQFEEIKLVAAVIKKYLDNLQSTSTTATILIVVSTIDFTTKLAMHLHQNNINCNNLLHIDVKQSLAINFVILLAELVADDFNLDRFASLSRAPLLLDRYCNLFDKVVHKYRLINASLQQILSDCSNSSDAELANWAHFMLESMQPILKYQHCHSVTVHELFEYLLEVAMNLTSGQIWQLEHSKNILEIITKVKEAIIYLGIIELKDFSNVIKEIIYNIKVNNNSYSDVQVIIADSDNSLLLNADYIIVTEFTNNNWPGHLQHNLWLHSALHSKLGIMDYDRHLAIKEYSLYKLLQTAPVVLTGSRFNMNNSQITESQFITKLQLIAARNPLINLNIIDIGNIDANKHSPAEPKQHLTTQQQSCGILPTTSHPISRVSATDIDILIRNPYAFYAKNILNLKPLEIYDDKSTYAKFGKFIHDTIHRYTATRKAMTLDALISYFINIGTQLITNYNDGALTTKIWLTRLEQIAKNFITFDQQRRYKGNNIFAEQYGTVSLNINEKPVSIVAVADRIEYDDSGSCTIIEFKTGTIPSRKEMEQEIATQLIVESIILYRGGFSQLPAIVPNKVIFVKVAASSTGFKMVEMPIDSEIIDKYERQIAQLLEYYLAPGGRFYSNAADKVTLKYNHYKHLARHI